MRPSSMRSSTSVISIAQPTGRTPSSPAQTIPNSRSLGQALADHRPVAVLEDVQRHVLVGERDEAEREQREVLRQAVGHPSRERTRALAPRPPGARRPGAAGVAALRVADGDADGGHDEPAGGDLHERARQRHVQVALAHDRR